MIHLQETVKYELTNTSEQLIMAQAERDQKALRIEQLTKQHGVEPDDSQAGSSQEPELAVIKGHLNKISALEKEVKHLKQVKLPQCTLHMIRLLPQSVSRQVCQNGG